MLFRSSEANMSQVLVMKQCLKNFCEASGQKVNAQKTRVFFSHNVNHNIRSQLSDSLGFTMAADLGKYLGVPLHHKKVSKADYQFVVDKVRSRLSLWKSNLFSLAARHTLVKSVVSTMPNHVMQTAIIPISCCDEIDKRARDFIWGSSEGKRKVHLVAWDKCCKPKSSWRLGFRHANIQNKAIFMKVGWGLITKKDALWTKVVRSKYQCGNDLIPNINKNLNGSRLWSGVKSIWEPFVRGVEVRSHQGIQKARWSHDRSGEFSVRSAYSLLTGEQRVGSNIWDKAWMLQIPQRCKLHIWTMLHDKLLSNERLQRWGVIQNGRCSLCLQEEETSIHVFRDCELVKPLWEELGVERLNLEFESDDFKSWVKLNLQSNSRLHDFNWSDMFSVMC